MDFEVCAYCRPDARQLPVRLVVLRPWILDAILAVGRGVQRLFSLERSFGIKEAKIPLRAEKLVLRDGQICVLDYKYKAKGGGEMIARVRFMVPNCVPHSFLENEIPELRFPDTV